MPVKPYTKSQLIKRLKELGKTDIELTYHKSEGWWLSCNGFDDWISMDNSGAMIRINKEFNNDN
jgi:hypothetical protein